MDTTVFYPKDELITFEKTNLSIRQGELWIRRQFV